MAKKTKKNNERYLMSQEYRNQYPSSNVPISGRKFYNMPSFDNQGNKIDSNKQETIGGELPFQAVFNPASLSISNRAAMADGGFINQFFGENSTLNKYINKGKSFLGLDSDVSDSPNVIAANQKPSTGSAGNNSTYEQGLADQNDLTSKTRYRPPEDTPLEEPTFTPTGGNNIGDASESSMASTTRMPKKQVLDLTYKGGLNELEIPTIPTGKDMKKAGKEASDARMKAAERSTSKNRFGLFGNYGKDVEIKKVRDASTGLISKQKFVDGERVQSGKEKRAARRSFRRFK